MIPSATITGGNLAPTTKTTIQTKGTVQRYSKVLGGSTNVSKVISMGSTLVKKKMEKEYVGKPGNSGTR